MRLLKLILISLVAFFLVICFLFALFPRDVSVSRVMIIHVSQQRLAGGLSNLSDWPRWNQFLSETDGVKINVATPANKPGSTIQKGELTIKLITTGIDTIKTKWSNSAGRSFNGLFIISPADKDSSYIEWKFNFHLHWYPWEKLGSMYYERQFGPIMEKSLFNLQDFLEKNP
jgi:hypothetical protein